MKLPKGTPVLSMDSPTFVEDFAKAAGIAPGEKVELIMPQFHRTDGLTVSAPSLTPEEWANLGRLPLDRVRQMGCQKWKDDDKGIHWLFPGQWYPHIPDGTKILFIDGEEGIFASGETGDDIRFGALAYGFLTPR